MSFLRSLFPAIIVAGLLACSHAQENDSSTSDITGTLSDARACAVVDAYRAASLGDFVVLAKEALPFALPAAVGNSPSLVAKFDVPSVGLVYVIEGNGVGGFYGPTGAPLASYRGSGAAMSFAGANDAPLVCSDPASSDAGITPPTGSIAISSLTPAVAYVGSAALTVTVHATGIVTGTKLLFNGQETNGRIVDASTMTCTVPFSALNVAGNYPITLRAPDGTSSPPASFEVRNVAPTVHALTPLRQVAGSPATPIVLQGEGFLPTSRILVGGKPIATVFLSTVTVSGTLPASAFTTPGPLWISASNPAPGGGDSEAFRLDVVAP